MRCGRFSFPNVAYVVFTQVPVFLKLKIAKLESNEGNGRQMNFDSRRLKNSTAKEEFKLEIKNRFDVLEETKFEDDTMQHKWENLKNIYKETAEKILGWILRRDKKPLLSDVIL